MPQKTAPAVPEHRLGLAEVVDLLVADGLVEHADGDALLVSQRQKPAEIHPLIVVANQKWVSKRPPQRVLGLEELTEWLARKVGLDYLRIDPLKIDFAAVTAVMSSAYATRFGVLPVQVGLREVVVATTQPFLREWEKEVAGILKKEIRRVVANPADVARYLVEFYNLARSVKNAAQSSGNSGASLSSFEQLVELGQGNRQFDANDSHIVNLVDWLWQYAFEQRASDIHIEPRRDMGLVRFRIDGVLHQVYQMPMSVLTAMTSRIKILGRMDVVEKRRPQDGRIKTRVASGKEVELRLSTLPTAFGEKLVMRIFDPEVLVRNMTELGFSEQDEARWHSIAGRPNGIILVTGPTGSGKTTTLYSVLSHMNDESVNIMTLEDPVEYPITRIRQTSISDGSKIDFSDGVRSLMRQDPDIILVGEVRDKDTAEMAFRAAMTGHQVFSTLHTNSALRSFQRIKDLGVSPEVMAGNIIGIVAQRLVRRVCVHCREEVQVTEGSIEARLIGAHAVGRTVYRAHHGGCEACGFQGYKGRLAIMELLRMDSMLDELITRNATLGELTAHAMAHGFAPMAEDGLRRVLEGITTVEEVGRVVDLTAKL